MVEVVHGILAHRVEIFSAFEPLRQIEKSNLDSL